MKNQARELVRQVSLNTSTEQLRNLLSRMVGLNEQQSYEQFEQSLQTCLNESDLMGDKVQITSFTCMLNEGLLTGEPLNQAQMYAYLTPEQNELLQMPERLDIHFEPTEEGRQVAKYQA